MRSRSLAREPLLVLSLQEEIRRCEQSRYDHRLHSVLLLAQGMSCRQTSTLLGDAPRTTEHWAKSFEQFGLEGLQESVRSGRPPRLSAAQMELVYKVVLAPPHLAGIHAAAWDVRSLAAFMKREFSVVLGIRQCQRIFKTLTLMSGDGLTPAGNEED